MKKIYAEFVAIWGFVFIWLSGSEVSLVGTSAFSYYLQPHLVPLSINLGHCQLTGMTGCVFIDRHFQV